MFRNAQRQPTLASIRESLQFIEQFARKKLGGKAFQAVVIFDFAEPLPSGPHRGELCAKGWKVRLAFIHVTYCHRAAYM